ncbi:MAG TPA: CsbD family protein [Acidimicrobiia bacterium]|nr:CsbD family protein [Acidimicrobiia bacterium]
MQDSTQMKWEGRWDQLKGKARQAWGDLTDDDLDVAEGNYEELVGRIKEKTGESAEVIRERLEDDSIVDSQF